MSKRTASEMEGTGTPARPPAAVSDRTVNDDLSICARLATGDLADATVETVTQDTLARLRELSPLAAALVSVKVVRNERRNFINIRLRREVLPTVFYERRASCTAFYALSDDLHPYAVLNLVAASGDLVDTVGALTDPICADILAVTDAFKRRFRIGGERYACVLGAEGKEFSSLKDALPLMRRCDAKLAFCIRMRVATAMYHERLPILRMFDTAQVRAFSGPDRAAACAGAAYMRNLTERGFARLKTNFLTSVFQHKGADTCFEFHLSDKFEPFAIVIALDPDGSGNLVRLSRAQVDELSAALDAFKAKFAAELGEEPLSFHYTSLAERLATDSFAEASGVATAHKAHSTVFHLKVRLPTAFYVASLPVLQALDMDRLLALDPVRYNFGRACVAWSDVRATLAGECDV